MARLLAERPPLERLELERDEDDREAVERELPEREPPEPAPLERDADVREPDEREGVERPLPLRPAAPLPLRAEPELLRVEREAEALACVSASRSLSKSFSACLLVFAASRRSARNAVVTSL